MKIKEQIRQLISARDEWVEKMKVKNFRRVTCTTDLVRYLFDTYYGFSMVERDHCCGKWDFCCYEEELSEGCWELTQRDVDDIIRYYLMLCRKTSRRKPIFYICEEDDGVKILLTYRHDIRELKADFYICAKRKAEKV